LTELFKGANRTLLIDAPSGIAGDMFLSGLSGLGFDLTELRDAFHAAGLTSLQLAAEERKSHGICGLGLKISIDDPQPVRHLSHCLAMVESLGLPPEAAALANRMFRRLAEVESRAHGVPIEEVHFHEVGAIDSLVDIIGAALGLFRLNVGHLYLRDLVIGRGTVKTQHGALPIPAPATLELLKGITVRESDLESELVTPTGALILAVCAEAVPAGFVWSPEAIAHGSGTRELPGRPNMLRLTMVGDNRTGAGSAVQRRQLPVVRCTLDDMNPERFSFLMEHLLELGALDVHYRPLQMKKNRPGVEVEVLVTDAVLDQVVNLLFRETTTLGLRIAREERLELPREIVTISTPLGKVRVKVATLPDGTRRGAPEYEDCATLAREKQLPLAEVEEMARRAWQTLEG
jgi:pyridinium-3,5-bisthiocarboxylic acid mononucleotide nickel chelatase